MQSYAPHDNLPCSFLSWKAMLNVKLRIVSNRKIKDTPVRPIASNRILTYILLNYLAKLSNPLRASQYYREM